MEYKTFFITDNQEKGKNHQTGKVFSRLAGDRPKKSHFVVKVLIESIEVDNVEVEKLKVHTEDYLLCGDLVEFEKNKSSEIEIIKDIIEKEGHKGGYGFFYAIIPKDGKTELDGENVVEIKINTCQIQPIECW